MKQVLKTLLAKVGMLDPAARVYAEMRLATPGAVFRGMRYRLAGRGPDGMPLPPSRLIHKVIGHGWSSIYFDSGSRIVAHMRSTLAANGIRLEDFDSVLDFGCGCGRLTRHLAAFPIERVTGTDLNPELVDWCQRNLSCATFDTNELEPPMRYPDASFDFIYGQSVFTHLGRELQVAWLRELHRLLTDGGVLLLTTHGPESAGLSPAESAVIAKGELVVRADAAEGANSYATFQSRSFFEHAIDEGFENVIYLPGTQQEHFEQDVNVFRKNGAHCHVA